MSNLTDFACRLNVDDLQEAIDFFTKKGGEQLTPIIQETDSRGQSPCHKKPDKRTVPLSYDIDYYSGEKSPVFLWYNTVSDTKRCYHDRGKI